MNKETKVKILTVIGKPTGTIVRTYLLNPNAGSLHYEYNSKLYWVRLKNGVLLKDVTDSEIEIIKQN